MTASTAAGEGMARRPYAARMPADERRTQLLEAALRIAVDSGFAAVTMDRVARTAGVTRPVVYGIFPDRDRLLAALLSRETDRARAALGPALPGVPDPGDVVDPDDLLLKGLRAYLTAVSAAPDTWRLVLFPVEGAPPALHEAVTTAREEALDQIRRLLIWGIAARRAGTDTSDLDVELFARMLVGLAEGAARMVLDQPQVWTVQRFTSFMRQMLTELSASS